MCKLTKYDIKNIDCLALSPGWLIPCLTEEVLARNRNHQIPKHSHLSTPEPPSTSLLDNLVWKDFLFCSFHQHGPIGWKFRASLFFFPHGFWCLIPPLCFLSLSWYPCKMLLYTCEAHILHGTVLIILINLILFKQRRKRSSWVPTT